MNDLQAYLLSFDPDVFQFVRIHFSNKAGVWYTYLQSYSPERIEYLQRYVRHTPHTPAEMKRAEEWVRRMMTDSV